MEQKKELLIKVLKKLQPYRDMTEGILALMESSYIDEKTIDAVIHTISQSIKTVKNKQEKIALTHGLEKIQKIKQMEDDEKMSDKELDKLLADI